MTSSSFSQLGNDIFGAEKQDWLGDSIGISKDGSRIAVAVKYSDFVDGTDNTGHVDIYEWSGTEWTKLGESIVGPSRQSYPTSISFSSDGSSIAIGSPFSGYGTDSYGGIANVFQWSGTSWIKKGQTITESQSNDDTGYEVALSPDGTQLAVSSHNAGIIRIFQWNGSSWSQQSQTLTTGIYPHLAYSGDGSTLAASISHADGQRGETSIYKWNNDSSQYELKGQIIRGDVAGGRHSSLSLSYNGDRIAIGSPGESEGGS